MRAPGGTGFTRRGGRKAGAWGRGVTASRGQFVSKDEEAVELDGGGKFSRTSMY